MANKATYAQRKAAGLCVKCGKTAAKQRQYQTAFFAKNAEKHTALQIVYMLRRYNPDAAQTMNVFFAASNCRLTITM